MTKYCKDCKYSKAFKYGNLCQNPVITGTSVYDGSANIAYIQFMRGNSSIMYPITCGPEGSYFEEKPEPEPAPNLRWYQKLFTRAKPQ